MTAWQRWWRVGVAVVLAVAGGCAGLPGQSDQSSSPVAPEGIDEPGVPKQLRSRQIIVALAERLRAEWPAIARELQARYQLRPVGEFPLTSIGVQCLVYQVPADRPLAAVLDELKADPRIELAQPNQSFEGLQTVFPPPYLDLAYGAKLIRANLTRGVSTGRGVSVAVIDTGADTDHPALRGRVAETATFVEGGEPSFRADRHGTAVAGVIGARADGTGLDGIAPETRLTVLKACWYPDPALAKARCSSWTVAKAVDYAINHNAQVINLSLGGQADALLARLLTTAMRRNMSVVAATLENPDDPGFPASLPGVIPVMACDMNRRVALPHWREIDFAVAAPGIDVVAPIPAAAYTLLSGSSLAAAHVTGVVALLLQGTPQASPDQIKILLRTTAQPVASSNRPASPKVGIIDACAALARQAPQLVCSER